MLYFKKSISVLIALLVIILFTGSGILFAKDNDKNLETDLANKSINVGYYLKLWYIHEEVDNEKKQSLSEDRATEEASGFSLNKARVILQGKNNNLSSYLQIKMEKGTFTLIDAFAMYSLFNNKLNIILGQQKIPATYESLKSDTNLDFVLHSTITTELLKWSLSKSVSSVSPFTGISTYGRDFGLSLKGTIKGFSLFAMMGNGFGANTFVGGENNTEVVYANSFGDYLYGARIDWKPLDTLGINIREDLNLRLGGHYLKNNHDNFLYQDKKTVLDIKRTSWSLDGELVFFKKYHFECMYAGGYVDDDFDNDGERDYSYYGYEIATKVDIIKNYLTAAFRYDKSSYEKTIFGGKETLSNYTIGIQTRLREDLMVMTNYIWKKTSGNLNQELDDNLFVIMVQFTGNF